MTLRRPAVHLHRAPGWRRSGGEPCWESLMSEDVLTPVACRPRAPRPQSAIEGGQLDSWLEHLHEMSSNLLTGTVHDQFPVFNNRTTSMPALDKDATGHAWRQQGIPFFSRGSSSCGSSSQCESLLGSQESLQAGLCPPPERRESWETAHIVQAPRKEQSQLSYLAQVKTGWLPIQRRVMVTDSFNQNQAIDHSAGQVKLKQPITPIFQKTRAIPKHQDEDVERSHNSSLGVKMWQAPKQGSPGIKQSQEKQRFPTNDGDRPVSWQVLRKGWNTNRVSALPGGSPSIQLPTGPSSDPNRKSPLMKTANLDSLGDAPLHQTALAEPWRPHTLLQGANNTAKHKSHTLFNRTSTVQPMRATTPLCRTNHSSQPSHIQTSSAVTTLIPQNKAGFSSITISSRKVSRSASSPGSTSQSSESPSPPPAHQPMDPNLRQVTVKRKATIVKVKEQRVMSSPATSTKREGTPHTSHSLDTVVHRRKATIIKVTEHRESYSSAKVECGPKHPEYRHSYTEGMYKDNSLSQHITPPLYHHLDSTNRLNTVVTPNTPSSDSEKHGGTLHRSTLSLFLSNPLARVAPTPSEASPKAVGQRSDRLHRPLSWYGNVFGNTEPSKENVTQAGATKWSFGLSQETNINPVNSNSSFIRSGTEVKEAGQLVAANFEPNRDDAEDPEQRASPCLTLIKAPDPSSHQSAEEVLALNAAAIIANIKLQRQLSKKKAQNNNSEKDSTASPLGNTVTDEGKSMKPHPDHSLIRRHSFPPAVFISLSLDPERTPKTISLQEALQRSRPDFISRSQGRVRELEQRTQERRELANMIDSQSGAAVRQKRSHCARSTSLNDNLLKPTDRTITGREIQLRSKRLLVEVKRKRDEQKKREVCLSNRQRVVLFKKKLLDQILHRSNN